LIIVNVVGDPADSVALRLWQRWSPLRPTAARVRALNLALVLLAIARTAGWIAHAAEEYDEPPLRFRGRAVRPRRRQP
jgi:citrate synthase